MIPSFLCLIIGTLTSEFAGMQLSFPPLLLVVASAARTILAVVRIDISTPADIGSPFSNPHFLEPFEVQSGQAWYTVEMHAPQANRDSHKCLGCTSEVGFCRLSHLEIEKDVTEARLLQVDDYSLLLLKSSEDMAVT